MFVGQHHHTLDAKKRIVIPSKFRLSFTPEEREEGIYVNLTTAKHTGTPLSYLNLYPPTAWTTLLERIGKIAESSEKAAWYLRKLASDTEFCRIDPQWRVLIPARLIKGSELKRDIMIVGGNDHIEIWNIEKWQQIGQWLDEHTSEFEKDIYRTP
ncbi:MAG: hypothetical protein KAS70_04445 [Planctomycetes bacterium]|nr:hypothetical protein [Planctomycetota bacterium]